MERELIVIAGPTASGKTDLAVQLAKLLNTEIISADSRQFYKYLNIGTAKPSQKDLKSVKHHMIDFLMPDEDYNVSRYRNDVLDICKKLWKYGQVPVISGGSGLYIKTLIEGLSDTPDPDPELRKNLLLEKEKFGADYLYDKLQDIDPKGASFIHSNNWKRVIRALEVYYLTGKTISEINENKYEIDFRVQQYGILWNREKLYARINLRCEEMIKDGLVDEVKRLLEMGYSKNLNSLNTLGYKEIISYLEGEYEISKAIELIRRNTRRYAKRQLTWFRKDKRIEWESIEREQDLFIFAGKIAANYKKD